MQRGYPLYMVGGGMLRLVGGNRGGRHFLRSYTHYIWLVHQSMVTIGCP